MGWTHISTHNYCQSTIHWYLIILFLPATVCPVPPPAPPGGQREVRSRNQTGFQKDVNIVVEGFIHYGARGAQEELFVGQRREQTEVLLFPGWHGKLIIGYVWWSSSLISLSAFVCEQFKPWHISAEHFCDGCALRQEEVKQGTLQRAEGLGSSVHWLPLRCHRWGIQTFSL